MRTSGTLLCGYVVLTVVACGGMAVSTGGDAGGGSGPSEDGSSPSSSGGSSTSSGGSSSNSSSSSGGSGSSSGSSSGGGSCAPLPGCASSTDCPAGDGCNTCYCEQGQWACTTHVCAQDGGMNVNCPPGPAVNDTACGAIGQKCDWPPDPTSACTGYECTCFPGYEWYCREVGCQDAGARDGGSDCPVTQPANQAPCFSNGLVCPYGVCMTSMHAYGTNCLCSNGAWDCASVGGCAVDGGQ